MRGGGQESSRRAGTENLAGIIGMAAALADCDPAAYAQLASVRDQIEAGLPKGATIWGREASRLANTVCFSAPGFASETQVMVMDLAGMAISAGSACSSGKVRASGVLTAMGATEEEAASAVRVSLGWDTPDDAADRFLRSWTKEYERVATKAA